MSKAIRTLIGSIGFMIAIIGLTGESDSILYNLEFLIVGGAIMWLYYIGCKRRGESFYD